MDTSTADCEILEQNITCITIPDDESFVQETNREQNSNTNLTTKLLENNDDLNMREDPECLFTVSFNDVNKFDEFKDGIIGALNEFLVNSHFSAEFMENKNLLHISAIKKKIEDDQLFTISIDPNPQIESDIGTIPSYRRSTNEALDSEVKPKPNEDECVRPKCYLCFNCSGDHALKDCPEPRNPQKISKARKLYSMKSERYHIDVEQRYAHLKPGVISKNLREALGLKSRELPSIFYRMRVLGYPPGWLEDSKVANSGISLFDSEGRTIIDPNLEDGVVENEKHKYDASKIISFPGYNVNPGSGYYDDYKYHCVPPMQAKDQKEVFIKSLGENLAKSGYKRKKLFIPEAVRPEIEARPEICTSTDMDIEDANNTSTTNYVFERPPPPSDEDMQPELPPPPPPSDELLASTPVKTSVNINNESTDLNSPYLADLELKHQKIMHEIMELEKNASGEIDMEISVDHAPNSPKANANDLQLTQSPATPQPTATTLESVLGTPLLKFSPFDKLPNGDNFRRGVCDVINFENLPDTTGKYEQMKKVLSKVRRKITKLNSEDD